MSPAVLSLAVLPSFAWLPPQPSEHTSASVRCKTTDLMVDLREAARAEPHDPFAMTPLRQCLNELSCVVAGVSTILQSDAPVALYDRSSDRGGTGLVRLPRSCLAANHTTHSRRVNASSDSHSEPIKSGLI